MAWVENGSLGDKSVPAFWIEKYETSVGDFAKFLKDVKLNGHTRCCDDGESSHQPLDWERQLQSRDQPVVGVSLAAAQAYARWRGKSLPTVSLWQLAARRAADGTLLAYPYGRRFDAEKTRFRGMSLASVRSLPEGASPSGCHHISGNAAEWALEVSEGGTTRAYVLGGSVAQEEPLFLRADAKVSEAGLQESDLLTIGFRCVVLAGERVEKK